MVEYTKLTRFFFVYHTVLPTKDDIGDIHLIVSYYVVDSIKKARHQRELDACLLTNLANPYISYVHVLLEDQAHVEAITSILPEMLATKLRLYLIGHRATFKDAFDYANVHLSNQVCILANADVFFEHSLSRLYPPNVLPLDDEVSEARVMMMHFKSCRPDHDLLLNCGWMQVFALLRWEVQDVDLQQMMEVAQRQSRLAAEGEIMAQYEAFHQAHTQDGTSGQGHCAYSSKLHPRIDSQDAWIFRSPLPSSLSKHVDFELGRPR